MDNGLFLVAADTINQLNEFTGKNVGGQANKFIAGLIAGIPTGI